MPTEPGFFEAFYAGPLQHPGLLWVAAVVGAAVALSRRSLSDGLRWYCIGLGLLSLTDAWLTANEIAGVGPLPPARQVAVHRHVAEADDRAAKSPSLAHGA